jgi:hypothetical protein
MNSKKIAAAPLTGNFSATAENAPVVREHSPQQQQYLNCPHQRELREEKARQQQMQQRQL